MGHRVYYWYTRKCTLVFLLRTAYLCHLVDVIVIIVTLHGCLGILWVLVNLQNMRVSGINAWRNGWRKSHIGSALILDWRCDRERGQVLWSSWITLARH